MLVLGLDPGSRHTGWGMVRQVGSRMQLVGAGILSPPAKAGLSSRLAHLHAGVTGLLADQPPDLVGMETVFHGPNTRSLVTLGQARGALLAAVGARGLGLIELTPSEVKKAVTGRGGARKEQVAHMVRAMLGPEALEGLGLDATDALAVALAAIQRRQHEARLGRAP